jgi:nucleoside-diphosphate-sugar epimerase
MNTANTLKTQGVQRALVTGANGFIGAALTLRLLQEGVAVRAVCRDPRKGAFLAESGAEVVAGDVQNESRIADQVKGCEVVYHVAAAFNQPATVMYRTNVIGTLNLAKAAYRAGVGRVIHVSSIAVYGLSVDGAVSESHPQQPSRFDYYQQTKQIGEAELWVYAQKTGLPVTVNRPAFVYGPRSDFWSRTLYRLMQSWPVMPEFPGNAHPIHVDDVVDLMIRQTVHPAAVGNAFNVSTDPAIPWPEFLGYYAQMTGKTGRIKFPARTLAPFVHPLNFWNLLSGYSQDISGSLYYLGNRAVYKMDKARDQLGWSPKISLATGMIGTEQWLKTLPSADV